MKIFKIFVFATLLTPCVQAFGALNSSTTPDLKKGIYCKQPGYFDRNEASPYCIAFRKAADYPAGIEFLIVSPVSNVSTPSQHYSWKPATCTLAEDTPVCAIEPGISSVQFISNEFGIITINDRGYVTKAVMKRIPAFDELSQP